ncbi:VOC family protein [Bailinhaonella thermotolerans]|uniref:VOC family protein n=1 Tax=Bailinhaonella thermotolerans TaxID=1070861 RepID=A0A3A4BBP1_9ACTN|nr:VOC family protein [Bailinhaonella thermotolerans]RJL35516.1 VOC family protein [Bailinhaonella thermotolerans]
MAVAGFDHLVLVAKDVAATLDWYHRVLGAQVRDLDRWRRGEADHPVLHFGTHKINVHDAGGDLAPRAADARPGALDLCFVWDADAEAARRHLLAHGQAVEFGPVDQEGARGAGRSVYTRDPDGNLIELICYPAEGPR